MLLGTSLPSTLMQCLSTSTVASPGCVRFQILAVLSPEPLASRSCLGFQAQMKTSLS